MRLRIERRTVSPTCDVHLLEVVTPRTNIASLTAAENLLGALASTEPFSLELAAEHQRRQFLVRTNSASMRQHLAGQLGAAYPQALLRPLPTDPALRLAEEQCRGCVLELRAPAYLPIRTFTDLDLDGERSGQTDPLLGVLAAVADLPPGWRALTQLILSVAPDHWGRGFERLAVQHPLAAERVARPSESSAPALLLLIVLLGACALGLQGLVLFQAGQRLHLAGLGGTSVVLLALTIVILPRLLRRPVYDMELVRDKVSRVAYHAEVRLSVFAPATATGQEVGQRLDRLVAAYHHFNLASGNGFRPRPIGARRHRAILNVRELAGLWHLPHAATDVPLLERTTARRWLPLPSAVTGACRIGLSSHQGQSVAVALPDDLLRRHLLLVAKTRRGKSTLLLRLAQYAMLAEPRQAVLLIDPHQDLAEAVLGCVPTARADDVVVIDLADADRPVGLNLLDAHLGWDRDRAVANVLAIFQREFGDRHWGPRMEDVFRFALLTLYEGNAARAVHERERQFTLLDVPSLLRDARMRTATLEHVADPTVRHWWSTYFDTLDPRLRTDVINPVLTKIHRFLGTTAPRHLVGQGASTIDPRGWVLSCSVVIVNTARGTVGDNAAALLGGTLLNLVALAVAEQARLAPAARTPVGIFVDEFHTIPGADYDAMLSELNKYGAHVVLATQSLARLEALGAERGRDLRATVFANLDGLFAFNCSAEDARYLVPELGGALDEQDLIELGEHQCYARISAGGERLPTFSVSLDPPVPVDEALRERLKAASAERYGRDADHVERDIRARMSPPSSPIEVPTPAPKPTRRNEHRPRKPRKQRIEVSGHA